MDPTDGKTKRGTLNDFKNYKIVPVAMKNEGLTVSGPALQIGIMHLVPWGALLYIGFDSASNPCVITNTTDMAQPIYIAYDAGDVMGGLHMMTLIYGDIQGTGFNPEGTEDDTWSTVLQVNSGAGLIAPCLIHETHAHTGVLNRNYPPLRVPAHGTVNITTFRFIGVIPGP